MKVADRWLPTFPNARYLVGGKEFEYWSADDSEDQPPIMKVAEHKFSFGS